MFWEIKLHQKAEENVVWPTIWGHHQTWENQWRNIINVLIQDVVYIFIVPWTVSSLSSRNKRDYFKKQELRGLLLGRVQSSVYIRNNGRFENNSFRNSWYMKKSYYIYQKGENRVITSQTYSGRVGPLAKLQQQLHKSKIYHWRTGNS